MTKTCLVLDDDTFMQTLIKVMLSNDGHRVLVASSVEEAFQILEQTQVDVITCDLMMPDTDGITFLKELTARSHLATIPVIVISASEARKDLEVARNYGAVTFVEKPFTMNDLRMALARLTSHNQ